MIQDLKPTPPWAKKRRRCQLETCNILFRPNRRDQRFCSSKHRSEYHFKTPTFRKFEDEIRKLCEKTIKRMVKPGALSQVELTIPSIRR
jgi:hypothetical protein